MWLPGSAPLGGVWLGCHLYSGDKLVNLNHHWQTLGTGEVEPDTEVTLEFELPPLEPGEYDLEFDCVALEIAWFAQSGSPTTRVHLSLQ
jgi:hypothetical protein